MPHSPVSLLEHASQWLQLWREAGKPRLPTSVNLCRHEFVDVIAIVDHSWVKIHFVKKTIEFGGLIFQPFCVFANDTDVTELIANLSEMPLEGNCFVTKFQDDSWSSMLSAVVAVQTAHCRACWLTGDVEGLRALNEVVVAEQIAALEAKIIEDRIARRCSILRSRCLRL